MTKLIAQFATFLAALVCTGAQSADQTHSPDGVAPVPAPRVIITAERDAEWASYRYAYKAAALFAGMTRGRPLIQAHMQIRPVDRNASLEGLEIRLAGKRTNLMLPIDAIGRATLPMLKEAYEDDAVLRLNRAKGLYYFSGRYSIRERDDGRYPLGALRAACEQLIGAQRDVGYRIRLLGKRCVGVRLVYPLSEPASPVTVQAGADAARALPLVEGQPFEGSGMGTYKVATYRFADWPAGGQLLSARRPLASGTVYE